MTAIESSGREGRVPGTRRPLFPGSWPGLLCRRFLYKLNNSIPSRVHWHHQTPEIGSLPHQRVPEFGVVKIGEEVDRKMFFGHKTEDGDGTIQAAGVELVHPSPVILLEPAQAIGSSNEDG